MVSKYFLLLLGISGLCTSEPQACTTTYIYGRISPYPVYSGKSILQAGVKTFALSIPDGNIGCKQNGYPLFVGEAVKACDYDYPPIVYKNNDPSSAIVSRTGNLQQDATAQVIYYCDF